MILEKRNKPESTTLDIDLTGPEGNAFVLMGYVRTFGRQLGYSEAKILAIQKVMRMGNYDGLINMFDKEFGDYVTLWR